MKDFSGFFYLLGKFILYKLASFYMMLSEIYQILLHSSVVTYAEWRFVHTSVMFGSLFFTLWTLSCFMLKPHLNTKFTKFLNFIRNYFLESLNVKERPFCLCYREYIFVNEKVFLSKPQKFRLHSCLQIIRNDCSAVWLNLSCFTVNCPTLSHFPYKEFDHAQIDLFHFNFFSIPYFKNHPLVFMYQKS